MAIADLISIPEAARLVGRTRVTVWRWVRDGRLRAVRVGVHTFVRRSEVAQLRRDLGGKRLRRSVQGRSKK